jgi:hypothetical protein
MIDYNEKNMVNLDIRMLMVCIVHSVDEGNTINKERFKDSDIDGSIATLPHLDCLKMILGTPLKEEDSGDNKSLKDQ